MLSPKLFHEKLAANFVPFYAHKVATKLLWCGPETKNVRALQEDCSFMIQPGTTAKPKVFLAERYGGSGLLYNGGGPVVVFSVNIR